MTENPTVSTDIPTATTEPEMDWAATPRELMGRIDPAAAETGAVKRLVNSVIDAVAPHLKEAKRGTMKASRAEDIWRGEVTPRYWEMDALRRAAAGDEITKEAKHEFAKLTAQLARVEALLLQDEEFMRPHADALRAVARRLDRTMDRGGRGDGRF